jgi:hypothetical protein
LRKVEKVHKKISLSGEDRILQVPWSQIYDPTGVFWLSTLLAALVGLLVILEAYICPFSLLVR